MLKKLKILVLIGVFIILAFFGYEIYKTKIYIWLPNYTEQVIQQIFGLSEKPNKNEPIDIMFLVVDHFEPDTSEEVENWMINYPGSVAGHVDADGRHPQHTWFYARYNTTWLDKIADLASRGYGDVEYHLHHGNDTSESLTQKIEAHKKMYGMDTYGFIHGLWGLDNSRGRGCCGVNNELTILKETGCYADFTLPSHHVAQGSIVNRIYYAIDDPVRPKSYNTGITARVGNTRRGDLMMLCGPTAVVFDPLPRVELPAIESDNPPTVQRVDAWIGANVHVVGQPNWVFVKIHTHAADNITAGIFFGAPVQAMYSYFETRYNDGMRYRLHYVTAREAYNIVRAAEDGRRGNPDLFRDYVIKPYRRGSQERAQ